MKWNQSLFNWTQTFKWSCQSRLWYWKNSIFSLCVDPWSWPRPDLAAASHLMPLRCPNCFFCCGLCMTGLDLLPLPPPPVCCHHVGHLPASEDAGQGEPRPHRLVRVPPSLVHQLCDPADVLGHRHHSPIRGQSHRLHSHQGRPRRRFRSLLLDPFHIHHSQGVVSPRGRWGGASWGRHFQCRGRGWEEICLILPVGRVHIIFSG